MGVDKLAGYHRRSISGCLWGRLAYVLNFALFPMNKEGPRQPHSSVAASERYILLSHRFFFLHVKNRRMCLVSPGDAILDMSNQGETPMQFDGLVHLAAKFKLNC